MSQFTSRPLHTNAKPLAKRRKLEKPEGPEVQRFSSASEITRSIQNSDEAGLTRVLTAVRNQLTLHYHETRPGPQDERVLLAKAWMEASPGARDIFDLWATVNQRQMGLCALMVSILSCLINLLTCHITYHPLGLVIIKTLLSPQWSQRLNLYINGSNSELILVSLKLFNGMSGFASGRERRAVLDAFAWESKVSKLLNMRRRTKSEDIPDTFVKPDIRTLYIFFVLSFINPLTSSVVKSSFLEQRRDVISSIFKGLNQDSYSVVRKILETCWVGLWSDARIKKTLKVSLFNETTLSHIHKLYERSSPEGDPDQIPADLAHHFLLAICTHPGTGVCFKDKGWYPRDSEVNVDPEDLRPGKIYNKILANLLKILKVNDDPRQQELALKIMTACPELVAGYWHTAGLTLEPRLSSKWLANVSFLGSVVSLPVPTGCSLVPDSDLHQPSPPPTATILDNVFPSVNLKIHLSRGLQSPSALVQHCAALALAKCLRKYAGILHWLNDVADSLEEDDEGQWRERIKIIEREVRRRVPDFQVIVAFSQQKLNDVSTLQSGAIPPDSPQYNPQRIALFSESALRLLWLYHACLPSLVAEVRFDVGKLLSSFLDTPHLVQDIGGLHTLRQLHVLRLLKESDQFVWFGRIGSSLDSNFYTLLKGYISSEVPAIRTAITSLLRHTLSENILFQHDTDEIFLWLDCLSVVPRGENAEAPDGALLGDEGIAVITLLDDCALRCTKTPYKYLEELCSFVRSGDVDADVESDPVAERPEVYPSPLLMTVIEQLSAKIGGRLFLPWELLAVASYCRKLVLKLATKVQDLQLLGKVSDKFNTLLTAGLFPEYPSINKGILRELSILKACLQGIMEPETDEPCGGSIEMEEFLRQLENMPQDSFTPISAFELVDWLRLVSHPLHISEAQRLVAAVERIHKPALRVLFQYLHPGSGLLWNSTNAVQNLEEAQIALTFDWLFIQTNTIDLEGPSCRGRLIQAILATEHSLPQVKGVLCLVGHRIKSCNEHPSSLELLVEFLVGLFEAVKPLLSTHEFKQMKRYMFCQLDSFQTLFRTPLADSPRKAFRRLLDGFLNPSNPEDKALVSEFITHWSLLFRKTGIALSSDDVNTVTLWVPFMEFKCLFPILDTLLSGASETLEESTVELLESILVVLAASRNKAGIMAGFQVRLPRLLNLSSVSHVVQSTISETVAFSLPLFHDGMQIDAQKRIGPLLTEAETRWDHRLDQLPEGLDMNAFLLQSPWADSTAKVVAALLYRSDSARKLFSAWLGTGNSAHLTMEHVIIVVYAFLDCSSETGLANSVSITIFERLLRFFLHDSADGKLRSICGKCISTLIQISSERTPFLESLRTEIRSVLVGTMNTDLLILGRRLSVDAKQDVREIITSIIDLGLQWAVRCLSQDSLDKTEFRPLKELSSLITEVGVSKVHFVEPVLTSGIKNHLHNRMVVDFCHALCKRTKSKPVLVNRNLQSIVQHPRFFASCSAADGPSPRDGVIRLLCTLFHMYPSNTCQPSHIEPLRQIYGGTLSVSDRTILSIFQLFEIQRKTSCASILCRWSGSTCSVSSDSLGALQSLDPNQVFRTCLQFPKWRLLDGDPMAEHNSALDVQSYDPIFIMLLFANMVSENIPGSVLDWVELFRTNVVCVIIRALSSKTSAIREFALSELMALWKRVEAIDMQEKHHVSHILNLLKATVAPVMPTEAPIRLPAHTTLILCHALRGVFYPSNFIYPLTARFLLQRPELDIHDVPMLFGMLYSNSDDDWKKERTWIIRFLSDGMISTDDWRVLKRRHTWDLLASMFQSFGKDHGLRSSILEVLANITCNRYATTSVLLKSGLLAWIEMQLQIGVKGEEGIGWVRILENILAIVDPIKMDSATQGEWQKTMVRCLLLLLDSAAAPSIFPVSVPVILRLGVMNSDISSLITKALKELEKLEDAVVVTDKFDDDDVTRLPQPPHRARTLFDLPQRQPVQVWGEAVEALWHITMTRGQKSESWDKLTCRMLVWRSIAGEESETCEWVRREVVKNLKIH